MRMVNRFVKCAVVATLAFALVACSKANSNAPQLNAAGQHPAGWITNHQAAALTDRTQCFPCHGTDLLGGISKVSCSSAQFNGQFCHSAGPAAQTHPAGWRDPGLHGATAKGQPGITSGFPHCQGCHGADFNGGVVGVSCFVANRPTGSCHGANAPHAALPWRTYPFPTHTDTVDDAAGLNTAICALCHTAGRNLSTPILTTYATGKPGCFNSTLCHGTMGGGGGGGSPHPAGWVQPPKHCVTARANLNECQTCHADNPTGGAGSNPRFNVPLGRLTYTNTTTNTTYTGCEVCHAPFAAHPRVVRELPVFNILTTFNPIGTPWYLHCKVSPSGFDTCNRCHGATLGGGPNGATGCTFCHRSALPSTTLHCTSCHADPPNGTTYPNIARVHAVHINGTRSPAFDCDDCHFGIGSVTLDHFNRAKLRTTSVQAGAVVFGAFAATGGVTPAYSDATLECTNTYCHGNSATIVGGTDKSPNWNQTNYLTAAGCGTCHGFPPGAPHTGAGSTATQCINCHPHVNASGTGFSDPTKHINGVVDFIAGGGGGPPHPFPYTGSAHKGAAVSPFTACLTCHANVSPGVYPVAAGTAPNCRGCHVKASPGNSCGSCHGTASNAGRPSGSVFPDIAGHHSNKHGGFSCATCHGANGTGQTSHGPSGGTAHNDANVVTIIEVTNPTGVIYTPNGAGGGTCNGTCTSGHNHNPETW